MSTAFVRSPHPDSYVNEGKQLFAQNGSACHGDTSKGGRGPDLTRGQWKHGASDEDIIRHTIKGIPGIQMPAIPLSEAEARKIVAFLRSLAGRAVEPPMTSNVATGRKLFFGAAQCSTCHMFGGRGDIPGADLTEVRGRHAEKNVVVSTIKPLLSRLERCLDRIGRKM